MDGARYLEDGKLTIFRRSGTYYERHVRSKAARSLVISEPLALGCQKAMGQGGTRMRINRRAPIILLAGLNFAPIAAAQDLTSLSCEDLWFERNRIFFSEGFCFKSPEGQSVFGTQCHAPYGQLNRAEEALTARIKRLEIARRCPQAPTSGAVLVNLRQRLGGAPVEQVAPAPIQSSVIPVPIVDSPSALTLARSLGALGAQIQALTAVLNEQKEERAAASSDAVGTVDETINLIQARIDAYRRELNSKEQSAGPYLTSVKPNDKELYVSARKVSENYPRVPFYIPGTTETGEFWVEPLVADTGDLRFSFKFVDKDSPVDKVRSQIDMDADQLNDVKQALLKVAQWSETAHKEKIARAFEKRVTCFPVQDCPNDGEGLPGRASTEIRFLVYENGATGGRIQRNKGRFVEAYNFSTDSAKLLRAYVEHVIKAANQEYRSGTQTRKDLDGLFK